MRGRITGTPVDDGVIFFAAVVLVKSGLVLRVCECVKLANHCALLKEGVRREVYTEWKRGKKLSRVAGVLVKAAIER